MGTISVSLPSDGQTIDAADYNTPINTIVTEINGNISNDNLATGAGEPGGAWTAFTPTLLFSTLGNGTLLGYYTQVGKTVRGYVEHVVGSTDTIAAGHSYTAPVLSDATFFGTGPTIGKGSYYDDSTGTLYQLQMIMQASNRMRPYALNASATYGTLTSTVSTVPVTWAADDKVRFSFEYQAA